MTALRSAIPNAQEPRMSTEEIFCLWDEWDDIEEELAGVSPTVRVQYDAMRKAVLKHYSGPVILPKGSTFSKAETLLEQDARTLKKSLAVEEIGPQNRDKKEPALKPPCLLAGLAQSSCFEPSGPQYPSAAKKPKPKANIQPSSGFGRDRLVRCVYRPRGFWDS